MMLEVWRFSRSFLTKDIPANECLYTGLCRFNLQTSKRFCNLLKRYNTRLEVTSNYLQPKCLP